MTNEELDKAVAEAHGWAKWYNWMDSDYDGEFPAYRVNGHGAVWAYWSKEDMELYSPSTNWQQAGELLEKYHIELEWKGAEWIASTYSPERESQSISSTPQRAICMAVLEAEK